MWSGILVFLGHTYIHQLACVYVEVKFPTKTLHYHAYHPVLDSFHQKQAVRPIVFSSHPQSTRIWLAGSYRGS